jgi:hypothetical protein
MKYTKEQILEQYNRYKKPDESLTSRKFKELTGISHRDLTKCFGPGAFSKLQKLAGDEPNRFGKDQVPLKEIMEQYGNLANNVWKIEGKLPTSAHWEHKELKPTITGLNVSHDIKWSEFPTRFHEYCQNNRELLNRFCSLIAFIESEIKCFQDGECVDDAKSGYVYLIQHGNRKEFKIGRTYNLVRREGEIRLELPEEVKPIHTIETDDPSGIEAYWHNRFKDKRLRNEWFQLNASDVKAFKKWKKIY